MIDLLATRPDTDPQARACARLLTAVIADSIRSIGAKPKMTRGCPSTSCLTRLPRSRVTVG
jgi:hypothetical protein